MKPGGSNSQLEICLFLRPAEAVLTDSPVTEILGANSEVISDGLGKATLQKKHRGGVFTFVALM